MEEKTRAQRRKDRAHKIRRRKELFLNEFYKFGLRDVDLPEGKLANGHKVSERLTGGRSVKTNTRKSHSRYRHKGGYGPANKYSPHDKRQLLKSNEREDRIE